MKYNRKRKKSVNLKKKKGFRKRAFTLKVVIGIE